MFDVITVQNRREITVRNPSSAVVEMTDVLTVQSTPRVTIRILFCLVFLSSFVPLYYIYEQTKRNYNTALLMHNKIEAAVNDTSRLYKLYEEERRNKLDNDLSSGAFKLQLQNIFRSWQDLTTRMPVKDNIQTLNRNRGKEQSDWFKMHILNIRPWENITPKTIVKDQIQTFEQHREKNLPLKFNV